MDHKLQAANCGSSVGEIVGESIVGFKLRPHSATAEMAGGLSHLDSKEGRVERGGCTASRLVVRLKDVVVDDSPEGWSASLDPLK